MNRPNWYQDEPLAGGRFHIPPLRSWTANSQILLLLAVTFFLQLTLRVERWLELDPPGLANPLHWYQFVSYALVHDPERLAHLGWNCLLIYFFGSQVEMDVGGRRQYYKFCALAALFAAMAYLVVEFVRRGTVPAPLMGASGVAYAILVAFATESPRRVINLFGLIPIQAWALALIVMLMALFEMLMRDNGVAHQAHLGGGLFGFAWVRYRGVLETFFARQRAHRAVAERIRADRQREEVDRLLDKISREGMPSLSKAERRFLESASRDLRNRR